MDVKSVLKSKRQEKHLTLDDVGRMVGVSAATVSRWESGDIANMKRDKIVKLANALEISPAVIMGWEKNLTEENSELIVDSLADNVLISNIKMLSKLSKEHQQTIYDMIAYWYEKEGHY